MDFKKPHHLLTRAGQSLAVVLLGIVLWLGASSLSVNSAVSTLQPLEAESAAETADAETAAETTAVESESIAADQTELPTDITETEAVTESESAESDPAAIIENPPRSLSEELNEIMMLQPRIQPDVSLTAMSWEQLEDELLAMTDSYSGRWSVYVKDLSNGNVISINDQQQQYSASLMKLFIMGAILEQIDQGTLEDSEEVDSLLNNMITVSDNGSANDLAGMLSSSGDHREGMELVTSFARRHGFTDTAQYNGISDSSLVFSADGNHTTARDCGEFLEAVYQGELVSHLASRRMENLLLDQEVTYKIPTALPEGVVSANKTGETDDTENDSAIVFSPGGDFILCIMSEKWDSKNQAVSRVRELTRVTYSYFNPDPALAE